ncbi:MAG: hypothetical protein V4622_05435 [Bacteroidota bacterium]
MALTQKTGDRINFSLDILSFILVCAFLMDKGQSDPGDVIFIFVYESFIMILGFTLFFVIFNTWHTFYVRRNKSGESTNYHIKITEVFQVFSKSLIYLGILFAMSFLVIIFLNQLTVELLIAYLTDNAYHFKSIEILSQNAMYFENEIVSGLKELFGKSYSAFFWIIGIKYFIELCLDLFIHEELKTNKDLTMNGFKGIALKIILGPICMFIACIFLVILASIYGAQTWIVLLTLGIFRLLFLFLDSKLKSVIKSI